jgi:hypothetical protein
MQRAYIFLLCGFLLVVGQVRDSLRPTFAAEVALVTRDAQTGQILPARVYLFKDTRPFRLSPVESLLSLRVDTFYREQLWRRVPDPVSLEVVKGEESHVLLLRGKASFDLPAGRYRVEAYRGTFYVPAIQEFDLLPSQKLDVALDLVPLRGREGWIAGDDHIHLVRRPEDDAVYLGWLAAEDLAVGNFLQLQRQQDAAMQYGFGDRAEARRPGFTIRSGIEARSHFYGHVNLLGPREILRPLSIGSVYANSHEAYPFPLVLFERGRKLGATVGYAHFDGSQKNSTLLMDVALGTIDFVEVLQFGVLKAELWYELLNAGFRVTGIAGSDFPVSLNRTPWPREMPLLGPERTLVKAKGRAPSLYQAWAEGVRAGHVVVSNGPLLDLTVNGNGPGAVLDATGILEGEATARFHRPLERLEIIVNGRVETGRDVTGLSEARLPFRISTRDSSWIAARVTSPSLGGQPVIQAHTNPVYVLRDGKPVAVSDARASLRARWERQATYYRSADLVFSREQDRAELIRKVDEALQVLRGSHTPAHANQHLQER